MNRILVVNGDDTAIRLLYTDELTEEGYEVITREGGSGLMELIEKKRPDLVVLDMPLGEGEGLSLCQDIRNAYDDLPVILSTVYAAAGPEGKSMTAEPCVCRSSDFNELKLAIRRAVEGRERWPAGAMFTDDVQGHGDSLQGRA
jgi:two-component system, response regulator, stage 0 sporulation protein F